MVVSDHGGGGVGDLVVVFVFFYCRFVVVSAEVVHNVFALVWQLAARARRWFPFFGVHKLNVRGLTVIRRASHCVGPDLSEPTMEPPKHYSSMFTQPWSVPIGADGVCSPVQRARSSTNGVFRL